MSFINVESDSSDSADDQLLKKALALSKETAARETSARAASYILEEECDLVR